MLLKIYVKSLIFTYIETYQQHKRFMRGTEFEHSMEPRDFFDQDFSKEIQNKIENTNIILMIDVNQNVIKGSFTKRMEEMGMGS